MNAVEDRLTQALAARAEQVQPEDLAPIELPDVRRPRATTYLLAAAAVATMVTVPLLALGLVDDDSGPADNSPPASNTPSESPSAEQVPGADWPVYERRSFDLDGDGTKERVRLRVSDPEWVEGPLRVESTLSGSGPVAVLLEGDLLSAALLEGRDLDGDGDLELLVHREFISDEVGRAITVLTLADGELVETNWPEQPRIGFDTDAQLHGRGWWWRGGVLHSYRSVEPFGSDGHDVIYPEEFRAQVWSWSLAETEMRAEPLGEWCVTGTEAGNPVPCDVDPSVSDAFYPSVESVIGVGESFEADLGGSAPVTVTLEPFAGTVDDGEIAEGDVSLLLTYQDGRELRAALPAGASPLASTTPVDVGEAGPGIAVRQEGGGTSAMAVYVVRGSELVALATSGEVPLGNTFDEWPEDAMSRWTWQATTGELYTARQFEGELAAEVWRWTADGESMTTEPLGVWCIDRDVNLPSARPC